MACGGCAKRNKAFKQRVQNELRQQREAKVLTRKERVEKRKLRIEARNKRIEQRNTIAKRKMQ